MPNKFYFMKKLMYCIGIVLLTIWALNILLIARLNAITIPFIALTPWTQHHEFGVIPLPLNNSISTYLIEKRAVNLVRELESEFGSDISLILYLTLDPDIAYKDAENLANILIKAGADINYKSPINGCTPVRNLIASENFKAAGYLLRKGADLSIRAENQKNENNICSLSVESLYIKYPELPTTSN